MAAFFLFYILHCSFPLLIWGMPPDLPSSFLGASLPLILPPKGVTFQRPGRGVFRYKNTHLITVSDNPLLVVRKATVWHVTKHWREQIQSLHPGTSMFNLESVNLFQESVTGREEKNMVKNEYMPVWECVHCVFVCVHAHLIGTGWPAQHSEEESHHGCLPSELPRVV